MAKICILIPDHFDAAKGGSEFQAHLLADQLARTTNHEVVYLTKRPPQATNQYAYRVVAIGGPGGPRWGMVWDSIALYRRLVELAPDVIIQRVACAHTGVAALYCRRYPCRLIWHVSNESDVGVRPELPVRRVLQPFDRVLFKYGVRHTDAVIAQTHRQAQLLAVNYGRTAAAVVRNFAPIPEKTWTKSDRFTVLWIANVKHLKQPELFVRLARELAEYDIAFRMIGRREASAWGDSIIASTKQTPNLEFVGELANDAVNAELGCAHLAVNTSTHEGLPNTFIQAWLHEVPTVTLNIDPDGMIAQHRLGFCSPDFEALKANVLAYFGDRELLARHGSTARAFAMREFSLDNVHQVLAVIDGARGGTGNASASAILRSKSTR